MKNLIILISFCFLANCYSKPQNSAAPQTNTNEQVLNDSLFHKQLYYYFEGKIGEDSISLYLVKSIHRASYIDGYLTFHKNKEPMPITGNGFTILKEYPMAPLHANTYESERKYDMKSIEISTPDFWIRGTLQKGQLIGEMRYYNSEKPSIDVSLNFIQKRSVTFEHQLCLERGFAGNFLIPQGLPQNCKLFEEIIKTIFDKQQISSNNICDYYKEVVNDTIFTLVKMTPIFINEKYANIKILREACDPKNDKADCSLDLTCFPFSFSLNRRVYLSDIIDMNYKDSLVSIVQRKYVTNREEREKNEPYFMHQFQTKFKITEEFIEDVNLIFEKDNFYITDTGIVFMFPFHGRYNTRIETFVPFADIKEYLKQ